MNFKTEYYIGEDLISEGKSFDEFMNDFCEKIVTRTPIPSGSYEIPIRDMDDDVKEHFFSYGLDENQSITIDLVRYNEN